MLRYSLSIIDVACESLSSRSSLNGCKFKCPFKDLLLLSPHIFCKFVGVPLPSIHVSSFFLNSLRLLCFELLKLVPPFLFFRFFPRSIVETVMWSGSFMCASQFPSNSLFCALYSLSIPLLHSQKDLFPTLSNIYSTGVESLRFTIV